MALDQIRDPFGRNSAKKTDVSSDAGVIKAQRDQKWAVQRTEDEHFLDPGGKPTPDHTGAETFDSEPLARLYADRAQGRHSGTWRAVEAPSPTAPNEPDDDDPDVAYGRLQQRKAA